MIDFNFDDLLIDNAMDLIEDNNYGAARATLSRSNLKNKAITKLLLDNIDSFDKRYSKIFKLYANNLEHDITDYNVLNNIGKFYWRTGQEEKTFDLLETHNIHKIYLGKLQCYYLKQRYKDAHIALDKFTHDSEFDSCRAYKIYSKKLKIFDKKMIDSKLLICGINGIGDQILYCSFLPEILKITKNITIITFDKLIPILKKKFPNINYIGDFFIDNLNLDNFDSIIMMGFLPSFGINSDDTFQRKQRAYLVSDKDKVNKIQSEHFNKNKLTIGFSWGSIRNERQGDWEIKTQKTIPLEDFLPLFQTPNTEFINLQHGYFNDELNEFIEKHNLSNTKTIPKFDITNDMEGLVNIIDACDIIISASNSLAHFAGAVGKKTYVIVPYKYSDGRLWFWHFTDDHANDWYDSVRVYEQETEGDWSVPVNQVKQELLKLNSGVK